MSVLNTDLQNRQTDHRTTIIHIKKISLIISLSFSQKWPFASLS